MLGFMSEENLLARLRSALAHAAEALNAPLTVRLWDSSSVALGEDPVGVLALASPGVIASLLRRPTLENAVRHYAAGNIALEGSDPFTILHAVRAKLKKKDVRRLRKAHLLRLLWPFLFVPGRTADARHDFKKEIAGAAHKNKYNKSYIEFHYDVGNEFYQLFLDPEMQYSCAYFKSLAGTLEQAQRDKLEMICRKLRLREGDRFLDIGCGWGGLICYAAERYGVRAHGITLSEEQYAFTKEKIRALGLEDRVTVEIRDYLALEGSYDKIASIGMFEHVGIANFPAYFQKIHSLLGERGILLNHAIARRAKADANATFARITPEKRLILKYIFPGAELAPIGHSLNALEGNGFEVHDVEAWREHYALTCAAWCPRLHANRERAIALAGAERYRLWAAYLAGVALGFQSGSILIFQTVATKRDKGASSLPLTRAGLYRG